MPELTNLSYIRELCSRHGFAFSKKLGQNFIINPDICPRICDAAGVNKDIGVLEIGPGFGTLTQQLAKRAGKVVAIELDKAVLPVLDETLAEFDNVKIINADVMKADLTKIIAEEFSGEVIVCANLPYYITSPILMRLLEERLPITSVTAMVQKEAAQRITAQPGKRECGAISYATHYHSVPQMLFDVKAGNFYPPPKITSSVIKLDVIKKLILGDSPQRQINLFKLIKAAFAQRRKTLNNSVSAVLGIEKPTLATAMEKAGIPLLARAEQLTLADYVKLEEKLFV